MRKCLATAAVLAAIVLSVPAVGQSQAAKVKAAPKIAATVALVDSLPVAGVPFVVQRRPGRMPLDLILLRASTTPAELSDAVRTLATARQSGGDFPLEAATIRIRPHQSAGKTRKEFPWAGQTLARLRKAKPQPVDGVGTVPAVAIWLPRQIRVGGGERAPTKP